MKKFVNILIFIAVFFIGSNFVEAATRATCEYETEFGTIKVTVSHTDIALVPTKKLENKIKLVNELKVEDFINEQGDIKCLDIIYQYNSSDSSRAIIRTYYANSKTTGDLRINLSGSSYQGNDSSDKEVVYDSTKYANCKYTDVSIYVSGSTLKVSVDDPTFKKVVSNELTAAHFYDENNEIKCLDKIWMTFSAIDRNKQISLSSIKKTALHIQNNLQDSDYGDVNNGGTTGNQGNSNTNNNKVDVNGTFSCEDEELAKILSIARRLLKVVTILVPVLLVVLLIIDIMKTITTADVDQKKLFKSISNRVIAAIAVFLVPYIIDFIVNIIPMGASNWRDCWNIEYTPETIDLVTSADEKVTKLEKYLAGTNPKKEKAMELYNNAVAAVNEIDGGKGGGAKMNLQIRLEIALKQKINRLED